MWEEEMAWTVAWTGKTIWGDYYSDSECFDEEQEAVAFCVKLKLKEDVYFIELQKSVVWRKGVQKIMIEEPLF